MSPFELGSVGDQPIPLDDALAAVLGWGNLKSRYEEFRPAS